MTSPQDPPSSGAPQPPHGQQFPPPSSPQSGPPGYPPADVTQPGYPPPGYPPPGAAQPGYAQPGYAQPGQPGYGQPGYAQPGQPAYAQPGHPGYGQPAPTGYGPTANGQPPYGQPGQPPYGQPGQPPYGQPAYGNPAPPLGAPAPKKSSGGKVALFVIGGIVALCLVLGIIGAVVHNSSSSHSTSTADKNRGNKGPTVGMNKPARDGAVEFTVKSVKCDVATVGSGDLISTAQGQFCLATIGIKNVSNTSWEYETSEDTAYTASGQEYHTDIEATVRANDEEKFFTKIFPNASGEVVVAWDIPKDQKIAKIRLEDGSLETDGALFTVS